MREALGDGYTEALRKTWKGDVPESADFVMFWWRKAAELVRDGKIQRFGFITTNSIHQTFNRRVLETFLNDGSGVGPPPEGRDGSPSLPPPGTRKSQAGRSPTDIRPDSPSTSQAHGPFGERSLPIHLAYAIPDHPWIDSADGAAVRIAMTVGAAGKGEGSLEMVNEEQGSEDGEVAVQLQSFRGAIAANLQVGADVSSCGPLKANERVCSRGVQVIGAGFIVKPEVARSLGLDTVPGVEQVIRGYRNGKDLTDKPRGVMVVDLFGMDVQEVESKFPAIYQHVLVNVKPERDQNNREGYRKNWWIHGEARGAFRPALIDLRRYIATVETSKHRFFAFLDQSILPDNKLLAIAVDDSFFLGVMSSFIHVRWSLACGSWLGVGNDSVYVKTRCFETFPFPSLSESPLKQRIRDLGERLDSHRKRQQELHPDLTLTGMYNVLEKLRSGEALNAKEKDIHDKGLVSVLKQIHDEIDHAVMEAYGWQDIVAKTQDSKTQEVRMEKPMCRSAVATPALSGATPFWPRTFDPKKRRRQPSLFELWPASCRRTPTQLRPMRHRRTTLVFLLSSRLLSSVSRTSLPAADRRRRRWNKPSSLDWSR